MVHSPWLHLMVSSAFKDKSNIMTHGQHNRKNNVYYGKSYGDKFYNSSSTHAEMDVISRIIGYKGRSDLFDIFCVRVHRTGTVGNSKPCSHCHKYMRKSGINIKDIYYSDGNGNIIKESFNTIQCTFISSGERLSRLKKETCNKKKKKNST